VYYAIYQLAGCFITLLCFPPLLIYWLFTGKYRKEVWQRFGFHDDLPHSAGERIWLHASSVGEVQAARALLPELKKAWPDADYILSTMTEQGRLTARQQLGDEVHCMYAPLDIHWIVRRVMNHFRPTIYICLETELWPAVLLAGKKAGMKLFLLNGRLSARSLSRYRLISSFMEEVLSCFSVISVIQDQDGERFRALGAADNTVTVQGNAKYDLTFWESSPEETAAHYRRLLGLAKGQPMLIAGSTHGGEEEMLLQAFEALQQDKRFEELVLLLAPRHLNRLPEVETLLTSGDTPFQRYSEVCQQGRIARVVLVDVVGELARLYSAATYVFCGGSLVEYGGHNIMEAAAFGRPVIYGPSMKDFADAVTLLESAGAGFQVHSTAELIDMVRYWADHPEEWQAAGQRARTVCEQQQGSAKRQVERIRDAIGK
jgi:3-deoxy-D-manno-octulosonic-acid transferase